MSSDTTVWIGWQFAPFYRRWQGWRRVLWWLWPIRWVVYETRDYGGMRIEDYYGSANEAAYYMARRVCELKDIEFLRPDADGES